MANVFKERRLLIGELFRLRFSLIYTVKDPSLHEPDAVFFLWSTSRTTSDSIVRIKKKKKKKTKKKERNPEDHTIIILWLRPTA